MTFTNFATLVVFAFLVGCASSPPPAKQTFPAAHPPLLAGKVLDGAPPATNSAVSAADLADPQAYANRFPSQARCEEAARAAIAVSRDKAWQVLSACVRRGHFTPLPHLLDGTWDEDLRTRADASSMLLQIVAARGGDVERDLRLLRQRHLPVYPLATVVAQPEAYRGRLVLLRVSIDEASAGDGPVEVRVSQLASVRGTSGSWDTRREFATREYTEKERQLIVRLARPDPRLEPGRELVLLGRFVGLRAPTEVEEKIPLVTILGYATPGPLHLDY